MYASAITEADAAVDVDDCPGDHRRGTAGRLRSAEHTAGARDTGCRRQAARGAQARCHEPGSCRHKPSRGRGGGPETSQRPRHRWQPRDHVFDHPDECGGRGYLRAVGRAVQGAEPESDRQGHGRVGHQHRPEAAHLHHGRHAAGHRPDERQLRQAVQGQRDHPEHDPVRREVPASPGRTSTRPSSTSASSTASCTCCPSRATSSSRTST